MKPLLLASALALAACSNSVAAQRPSEAEAQANCRLIADYAEAIMSARQRNADMAEVMKVATDPDGKMEKWKRALIVEAYGSPRFETEPVKTNTIRDFRNMAYLACTRGSQK